METHLVWSLPKALTVLNNHLLLYTFWSQMTWICFLFFLFKTLAIICWERQSHAVCGPPWLCESGCGRGTPHPPTERQSAHPHSPGWACPLPREYFSVSGSMHVPVSCLMPMWMALSTPTPRFLVFWNHRGRVSALPL